ncbi:ceramide synthase-like isoform X2 [Syngnathoides biaculeatus]|uniref:ceramide synthase-like isoform X2 n=1 Tax=Syngnathoides biaculeatus TaxID=300417 RepID=UPI002ADDACCE|nr:ceramide synthase-like isoform X2 [Syngnathoides biaculeatus]
MFKTFACGTVTFVGLYFGFRKVFRKTFTRWSDADVLIVSERLIDVIHASLASATGVITVTSCKNVMTDSHWMLNEFLLFGYSYSAIDLYASYMSHFHTHRLRGNSMYNKQSLTTLKAFLSSYWLTVLHHLAVLGILLPIGVFYRRGLGDFFIGCLFITELSVAFASISKIIVQVGLENSRLHKINSILVLLTFLMCRIFIFPYMYWKYGHDFGIPLHKVPFHLPWHCNVGNVAIFLPQLYWFYLQLKKAQRVFRHKKEI